MKTFLLLILALLFTTKNSISQVPHAPSDLHATAVSTSQIVLHWTDNSNNEDNFNIEMNTSGHNDTLFSLIGQVSHNVTSFNVYHLSPNTTYHFRVSASNHSGTSHYSNIAGATTFHDSTHTSIPIAPSHLIAHQTSLSTTIGLTWQDNSNNESGFTIQMKGPLDSAFHNKGHVGSNITSFVADNLHPNTTYSFRVYAFNKAGSSHYSNIVTATTNGHAAHDYDFILNTNYPNPFNPKTIINYQLSRFNNVSLKVYDILGNEVVTLVNEKQDAGNHSIEFDGSKYSSGIYFYKLQTGDFSKVRKMTLIK